ncbi:MAG: hypothetical protein KC503_15215 [Myxococcales bacterium]|nr:hypothetical protein [Myxococcales bacterium]
MIAVALVVAISSRCAGSADPRFCPQIPSCPELGCCDVDTLCQTRVCQGVQWLCRAVPEGGLRWLAGNGQCESSIPDALPNDATDGGAPDGGGCTSTSCGANASCEQGGCKCKQGYVNSDSAWSNGCEAIDPQCRWTNCGRCPADYCGPNAECRDNTKCRCANINFKETLDSNGIFLGCLTPTSGCRDDNCNSCYTGYCGVHADCRQNKCKCTDSGWISCNGQWERSGCECNATCSGGVCK